MTTKDYNKPSFDPNKEYEPLDQKPVFNPEAEYEPLDEVKKKQSLDGSQDLGGWFKKAASSAGAKTPASNVISTLKKQEPVLQKLQNQPKPSINKEEFDNDPVGSVAKFVYGQAEKIRGVRDLSQPVASSTAVAPPTLKIKEAKEQNVADIRQKEQKPEFNLTREEAHEAIKEATNFYSQNTGESLAHLMKKTGIRNPDELYSDAADERIKKSLQLGNATDKLSY
jgi:hypothetical protein